MRFPGRVAAQRENSGAGVEEDDNPFVRDRHFAHSVCSFCFFLPRSAEPRASMGWSLVRELVRKNSPATALRRKRQCSSAVP